MLTRAAHKIMGEFNDERNAVTELALLSVPLYFPLQP
jgi:hypothetical protein